MKIVILFLLASVACWAQTPTLVAHAAAARVTTGLAAASYSSGGTLSGTVGETCAVTGFNGGGSGATATVALTGTNAIAFATPLVITAIGSGYAIPGYPNPFTATLGNGTATCSGTVTLTSASVGIARTTAIDTTACTQHCAFILFTANSPAAGLTAPYDSVGNVFVQVPPLPTTTPTAVNYPIHSSDDVGYKTWLCMGCTTNASHTFSLPGSGAVIAVMVFQNGASGPDLQANSGTTGNPNAGPLTPTNNDEIIVSGVGVCGGSSYAITSGGLTNLDSVNWNNGYNGNEGLADAYAIQTTAAAISANYNTGSGCSATQLVTLFSAAAPATLAATNTAIVEGFENVPYSFTFTATGGVAPYTCGAISSLPTGITQGTGQKTCTISGTPTVTANATSISVTFTDDVGSMATTSGLAITIASTILSISTTSLATGTQYSTYSASVAGTGGTSPYTYSIGPYPSSGLPGGIALNSSTGALTSSLIGGQGSYGIQFCATDSLNAVGCKFLTIGITGSNAWMSSVFPSNAIFHTNIASLPVDTSPAAPFISNYSGQFLNVEFGGFQTGQGHTPAGFIPIEVPYNQAGVNVTVTCYQFYFGAGSTTLPNCGGGTGNPDTCTGACPSTAPIPPYQDIQDSTACGTGCDSHSITWVEPGGGNPGALYEMDQAVPNSLPTPTSWTATSNALWANTATNTMILAGTTDAAGLPILPLLYNVDEVIGTGTPTSPNGTVTHAGRLTLGQTLDYYLLPATTQYTGYGSCASSGGTIPRTTQLSQSSPPVSCTFGSAMGQYYRVKASYTGPVCLSSSPMATILFTAFKNYGFMIADNGNPIGTIDGTADTRWVDADLACLNSVPFTQLEPVNVSSIYPESAGSFLAGTSSLPSITTTCPLTPAIVGQPYTATLVATNPPITWSIASGSLPTGLSLSGAIISGTPTTAQVASFSIGASNTAGAGINSPLSCGITVTAFQQPNGVGVSGSVTISGAVRVAQ